MTVEHSQPSVGTSATAVAKAIGVTDQVSVQNTSAVSIYLGGSAVTTSSYGCVLSPSEVFTADLPPGATLYGVVATTTSTVHVMQIGLGA